MIRTAIFVEGVTDLVFVRHLLTLLFGWENVSFNCLALRNDKAMPREYSYPNPNAQFYFELYDCGSDTNVPTFIVQHEKRLRAEGFNHLVGLRDMYSDQYKKFVNKKNKKSGIDEFITQKMIQEHFNAIQKNCEQPQTIQLCFAIMETEAWLLGMYPVFEKIDPSLTPHFITSQLGFDLHTIDPQAHFYIPHNDLERVLRLANKPYSKHPDEMETIVRLITKDDVDDLLQSDKCPSFKQFCHVLCNLS